MFFRKVLLYGLPVYLYLLELIVKALANVQQESLAGPTLAGAGIGFMLPLTELKSVTISPTLKQLLDQNKLKSYLPEDKSFADGVWLAFFISLGLWMFSLYLTIHRSQSVAFGGLNLPLTIGLIIFVASVLLSEYKERI